MFQMALSTRLSAFVLVVCVLVALPLAGQEKATGPVIEQFGPVWQIPDATFEMDKHAEYRVVFDVMNSPEDPTARNPWMETAARFLNMHAQAGVSPSQLHVALVVHNQATKDLLKNEHYKEAFGVDNPNAPMLAALLEAGVQVILCGQSSRSRGVPLADTVPGTDLALSAMTALIELQNQGYRLIKF